MCFSDSGGSLIILQTCHLAAHRSSWNGDAKFDWEELTLRELIFRILRRSIPVAIALAIMGYLMGEAFLLFLQMRSPSTGTVVQVERWRGPVNLAMLGVAVLIMFEVIGFVIKRKKPPHPVDPDAELRNISSAR